MKRTLRLLGIGLVLLGAAFGVGFYVGRLEVTPLRSALEEAMRDRPVLELYRARREIEQKNFGNAAEHILAAQKAASSVPTLRAFEERFPQALVAARAVDPKVQTLLESLLSELSK
jgi:hypothetical protein